MEVYNMERSTSIFYKMTPQNENSVTELLCNLFRIKYFRDICLEFFGIEKIFFDEILLKNIKTQFKTDKSGIPDMVIETANLKYIIENKIQPDADLQENQKENYTNFLLKFKKTQRKHIGYIFLIPKNYRYEDEMEEVRQKHTFVQKCYWQDFLKYLYNKELDKESPIIKEGLQYFSEFIQKDEVDLTLNAREVTIMYDPKTIYGVLDLVEKVRGIVENSLNNVVKKMGDNYSVGSRQNDQNGQGLNLMYKKREPIFVGINPSLCDEQNGDFVFSVVLLKKHLKENSIIDGKKFRNFSDDEYIFICIDRKLFVEDNKEQLLADEIIKILKNVYEKNHLEK
jgi:hypothetical protein